MSDSPLQATDIHSLPVLHGDTLSSDRGCIDSCNPPLPHLASALDMLVIYISYEQSRNNSNLIIIFFNILKQLRTYSHREI